MHPGARVGRQGTGPGASLPAPQPRGPMSVRSSLLLPCAVLAFVAVPGCRVEGTDLSRDGSILADIGPLRDAPPLMGEDAGPLPEGCVPEVCDNEVDDD